MFRRRYSLSYLIGSVPNSKAPHIARPAPRPPKPSAALLARLIYTPHDLQLYFQNNVYSQPLQAQLSQADALFYNSKVNHEWTCIDYDQIPDVKYALLHQQRQLELSKAQSSAKPTVGSPMAAKTSFGIEPRLLKPLPEVLMLGHTNAGKSTLINSLLLLKQDAKTPHLVLEYAYVSKREGYTKCLNCYNLGNKLRLVDSPGYGQYGEESQGKAVLDYIGKRSQLRRTFLIIDSVKGLRHEDVALVDHLTELGAPFEVILTKIDELTLKIHQQVVKALGNGCSVVNAAQDINTRLIEHLQRLIHDSGLGNLASLPRILFNNSRCNKVLGKRYGFHEIRHAIAESCGLAESSEPATDPAASAGGPGGKKAVRSLRVPG